MACSSSGLSPLHLNLWVRLKFTAYATEVSDVKGLQRTVLNGYEMISRTLDFSRESVHRTSSVQRSALKLEVNTLSMFCDHHMTLTQKPYFRRHIFM